MGRRSSIVLLLVLLLRLARGLALLAVELSLAGFWRRKLTMSRSWLLASSSWRSRYLAFFCRLEMSSLSEFLVASCLLLISARGCSMNLGSAASLKRCEAEEKGRRRPGEQYEEREAAVRQVRGSNSRDARGLARA
jgi:hypothetical protein